MPKPDAQEVTCCLTRLATLSHRLAKAVSSKQAFDVLRLFLMISVPLIAGGVKMCNSLLDREISYVTGEGDRRAVDLPDRSILQINENSALYARFDRDIRRIRIQKGEASFDVAGDPIRPFVVVSPQARVNGAGARFGMRINQAGTEITLVNDSTPVTIDFAPRWGVKEPYLYGESRRFVLKAGNVLVTRGGRLIMGRAAVADTSAASGDKLFFRNTSLRDAVAEINAFYKQPLRIEDPALANEEINGSFTAYDRQTFIDYVRRFHSAQWERLPDGTEILTRRQDSRLQLTDGN